MGFQIYICCVIALFLMAVTFAARVEWEIWKEKQRGKASDDEMDMPALR